LFNINKFKLLVSLIIVEVLTIIVLFGIIFLNSGSNSTGSRVITFTQSSIIYSTEDSSIPFTGRMQDTLCNQVIVEFDVVDGFKEGEFLMLTMDGNFAVHGFMKKNRNHGKWNYYYDGGKLECTGLFENDQPVGKWEWFYDNGTKKCEGNYIHGKEDGIWKRYDENGTLRTFINYRAGQVVSSVEISALKKV